MDNYINGIEYVNKRTGEITADNSVAVCGWFADGDTVSVLLYGVETWLWVPQK